MILSAKLLKNVASVNNWQYASQWAFAEGQAKDLYFQIVDLEKETAVTVKNSAFPEQPIRYMSQASVVSVEVIFDAIDDEEVIEIAGTQPFADDKSIFKVSLTSSQVPNSGNVKISLTEDGVTKTFIVKNAISVEMLNVGGC